MQLHTFVGFHPDHCFFQIDLGVTPSGRHKYAYCGEPNDNDTAHTPNQSLLAARELVELTNSVKAEENIEDYGNALSVYSPEQIQQLRFWLKELLRVRETMNWDSPVLASLRA